MNTLRSLAAALACYSFKGHDFDVCGRKARSSVGRRAKRVTVRAERRVARSMERTAVQEMWAEEWDELLALEEERRYELTSAFRAEYEELYEQDPAYADDWADRHEELYLGEAE